MNFVCITKDTPASVLIYVADETISTVSELETGLAGHLYIVQVGNQVWDKTFAHGYTKTTSSWEAIAGGGGSTSSNIFYATYGTTTYQEVHDAILEGKIAIVYMKATVPDTQCETYVSLYLGPGDVSFVHVDANSGNCVYTRVIKVLKEDNEWKQYDLIEYCEPQAGSNITITKTLVNNKYKNIISATDTTYTAGTGIDITNNVISATGGSGGIFYCETGITTGEQMVAAYNAGKQLIVKDEFNLGKFRYADLEYYKPDVSYPEFYFTVIINEHSIRYMYTDGQWTSTETILQTLLPVIQGTDTF